MQAERQGRSAWCGGLEDRVDDLPALLDLLPQLDVVVTDSVNGVDAQRTGDMTFTATAAGVFDTVEVTFNGEPIFSMKFDGKHLTNVVSRRIEGDAPGKIAGMIYEVIERGALLATEARD